MLRFAAVTAVVLTATTLACTSAEPPKRVAPAAAVAPVEAWVPVATYFGFETATGDRIFEILLAVGIDSSAGGSLGYTVNVPEHDAARARDVLRAAIRNKALTPTVDVVG